MFICKMEIKIIKSRYNIQIMRRLQETLKKIITFIDGTIYQPNNRSEDIH